MTSDFIFLFNLQFLLALFSSPQDVSIPSPHYLVLFPLVLKKETFLSWPAAQLKGRIWIFVMAIFQSFFHLFFENKTISNVLNRFETIKSPFVLVRRSTCLVCTFFLPKSTNKLNTNTSKYYLFVSPFCLLLKKNKTNSLSCYTARDDFNDVSRVLSMYFSLS